MSLDKINNQRKQEKIQRVLQVKRILEEGITKTSEIKSILAKSGVEISSRTIRRIKKQVLSEKVEPVNKTVKTPKPKKKESLGIYDSGWVHCPICGSGGYLSNNPNQTIECMQCGTAYDRKAKKWYWLTTGQYIKSKHEKRPVRFLSLVEQWLDI